jgi:hypothetical protein
MCTPAPPPAPPREHQIASVMDRFERQFDDLDVRTGVMDKAIASSTATSTPEDEVDAVMRAVAEENALDLKAIMAEAGSGPVGTGVSAGAGRVEAPVMAPIGVDAPAVPPSGGAGGPRGPSGGDGSGGGGGALPAAGGAGGGGGGGGGGGMSAGAAAASELEAQLRAMRGM